MSKRDLIFICLTAAILIAFTIRNMKNYVIDNDGYISIFNGYNGIAQFFGDVLHYTINTLIAIFFAAVPTTIISGLIYMVFM